MICLRDKKTEDPTVTAAVREVCKDYILSDDGVLYRRWDVGSVRPRLSTLQFRAVMPTSLRAELMRQYHDGVCGGHLGEAATYGRIADKFFWPTMYPDVIQYVKSCAKCAARKTSYRHVQLPLHSIPRPTEPFEALGIDVLGPLPLTKKGNRYILVVTDYHTRWPFAFAMKNQRAATIATLLIEQVFCQHDAG